MPKKTKDEEKPPVTPPPADPAPPVDTTPAVVVKPAELITGDTPPEIPADPGNNPPPNIPENQPPNIPPDNAPPAGENPPPTDNPAAVTATPSQIIAGDIPTAQALPPPPGQPGKRDRRGRPSIPHPECKKCGRKHPIGPCPEKGAQSASSVVIPDTGLPSDITSEATPQPAVNHRQLAEIVFDLSTNAAAGFLGPEWKCADPKEREGVIVPMEIYFRSKQMDDIPPGALLAFALASYSAPRLRAEPTKAKLKLGWAWIREKWAARKRRQLPAPKIVNNSDPENPFSVKN